MPSAIQVLQQHWGHPSFRPGQEDIINAVLDGRDTLALLPTGGGKSICYQVPGLMSGGLTIVISPLIALMRDQVEGLNRRGIAAAVINSTLSFSKIDYKLNQAMKGAYRFLYIAPERVNTDMFKARVQRMSVQLIAVDEAHCISQWGYDFRPAYQNLPQLREWLPNVPIIAVTATATPEVRKDILEKLEMKKPAVFTQSFRRENLSFRIYHTDNAIGKVIELVSKYPGSGIIYARTRHRTEYLAKTLTEQGVTAAAYHGGMDNTLRSHTQESWLTGETRVIAATNAFGMGIDKPDVRFVIHYNMPSDLESYYQEAGRAGRDGKPAVAAAIRTARDLDELKSWTIERYPPFETVINAYEKLCDIFRIPNVGKVEAIHGFDLPKTARLAKMPGRTFYHSLKILDSEGVINFEESPDHYARIQFRIGARAVLQFKENHPGYAKLVDFILRNSGGEVYTQYISFQPGNWANRLEIRMEELEKQLNFMGERNWIFYQPARAQPVVRFFQARHRPTRLELTWHKYIFLKDLAQKRLASLMEYTDLSKGCRSRYIQQYFGEETREVCGKCDICLRKATPKLSRNDFLDRVKAELQKESLPYRELLSRLDLQPKDPGVTLLREFIDQHLIKVDETAMVSWPESNE